MGMFDDILAAQPKGKTGLFDDIIAAEKPSVAEDVAKSAGSGLAKGAAGLVTAPVDIPKMAEYGVSYLLAKAAEKAGLMPKGKTAEDFVRSAQETFGAPEFAAPKAVAAINKVVPLHEPQTTAGRYAGSIAEMAPGVLAGGGGLLSKGVQTVGAGVGSEAAGQLASGTKYELPARLAGGILGGAPGFRVGAPSVAERTVQGAMTGITPQQLGAAERLFSSAQSSGVPLTRAEAVQAVTNGATRLGDIQRVIEGQGELRGFMSQRPQQVEAAGRGILGRIAPMTDQPSTVGPNLSKAAESVIIDANRARAAATKPYYEAASAGNVQEPTIEGLLKEIDAQIAADKTGLSHGPLNELRSSLIAAPETPGAPSQRTPVTDPRTGAVIRYEMTPAIPSQPRELVTDIGNLDRARKYFRDKMELPAFAPNAIDKETGARIGSLTDRLDTAMENASPAYRQAKAVHQAETKSRIEPLTSGPVGKIADAKSTEAAIGSVFPRNPLPGSERQLSSSIKAIGGKAPEATQQFVRQHIESVFNNATRDLQAGANQYGGANFVSQLRGNPQQAKNLEAAVRALPNGDTKWTALNNVLDAMEATGQRQRIGSQTAFNQELQSQLKGGKNASEAFNIAMSGGTKWPQFIRDKFQGWMLGKNTAEIAQLLTDPSKDAIFRQLATSKPGSGAFKNALGRMLLISQSESTKKGSGESR